MFIYNPKHIIQSHAHVPLASRRLSQQHTMNGNNAIGHGLAKVLALVTGGKALFLPLLGVIVDAIIADMDKVGVLGILILAYRLAPNVGFELLGTSSARHL